ncbi:MAG: hypothetical protein PVF91_05960 [Chromatiales bacterium]|jgi:hypothetical protein
MEDGLGEQHVRLRYLKAALAVFGIIFILVVPVMMMWAWPAGSSRTPGQPEYEQMIMGIYQPWASSCSWLPKTLWPT